MTVAKITILAAAILSFAGLAACASDEDRYEHHHRDGDERRDDGYGGDHQQYNRAPDPYRP